MLRETDTSANNGRNIVAVALFDVNSVTMATSVAIQGVMRRYGIECKQLRCEAIQSDKPLSRTPSARANPAMEKGAQVNLSFFPQFRPVQRQFVRMLGYTSCKEGPTSTKHKNNIPRELLAVCPSHQLLLASEWHDK